MTQTLSPSDAVHTMGVTASGAAQPRSSRYLWSVIGVLTAVSLAMAAALVQVRTHPAAMVEAQTLTAAIPAPPAAAVELPVVEQVAPVSKGKVPPAPVKRAQAAIKSGVSKAPEPAVQVPPTAKVVAQAPAPVVNAPAMQPPAPPPRVVCAHCGVVEAVTPVQREAATGSGAGAVAGAVLGGLVGNQIGGGDGKTLATIIGMVGGGWAGNTVEKRIKTQTVYQVDVRMEDGSVQHLEQSDPIAVGAHVTVEGGVISL